MLRYRLARLGRKIRQEISNTWKRIIAPIAKRRQARKEYEAAMKQQLELHHGLNLEQARREAMNSNAAQDWFTRRRSRY